MNHHAPFHLLDTHFNLPPRPLHPPHAPHAPPLQGCADTFGSINAGESLQSFLARLGLEKLLPIFMQNDVTQLAELRLLTDADFKEMSILIGSRRKILDALGTGGGVGLGQGGIGGGRGVAPASTSDSFLAGLASPPAAMAATAVAAIGSSPLMDGAASGGGGGSCDMFGALSMVGGGAVAPAQAVDMFGALNMAAGADAADVPPTPPSSASAFGFLGGVKSLFLCMLALRDDSTARLVPVCKRPSQHCDAPSPRKLLLQIDQPPAAVKTGKPSIEYTCLRIAA